MRQYFGVFKKRLDINKLEKEKDEKEKEKNISNIEGSSLELGKIQKNNDDELSNNSGVETVVSELGNIPETVSPTDIELELSEDNIEQPSGVESEQDDIEIRPPTPPLKEDKVPTPPKSPLEITTTSFIYDLPTRNTESKEETPAEKELNKKLITFQKSVNDLIETSLRLKNIEFTFLSENKKDIILELRKNNPSKEVIFKYIDDITSFETNFIDTENDVDRLNKFLEKLKDNIIRTRIRMMYGIQVKDNNDIIYYFNEILKILKQMKKDKGEKRVRGTIGRNIKEVVKRNDDFKGEDKGSGMKLIVRAVIAEMNEINKLFTLYQVFAQQLGIKDILSNMKRKDVSEIDEALSFINKTVTDADVGGRRKTQEIKIKIKEKKHQKDKKEQEEKQ